MAVPGSVPAASIWPVFLHGAAFGAGMLAVFAAFCGALLAVDAARRRAVARARLRRALADLDAEDIVTLIQRQGGNAELRRGVASGGPARLAAGEQAAAEEGAFQRAVAVHTAAAEPGHFTRGVQARKRRAVRRQHPAAEVGLQAAEGFAGEDVEPHGDQRAGRGIKDLVGRCG